MTSQTPATDSLLLLAISHVELLIFAEQDRLESRARVSSPDSVWGAFLGDAEVDQLVQEPSAAGSSGPLAETALALLEAIKESRSRLATALAAGLEAAANGEAVGPLLRLIRAFGLDSVDVELLLLTLAPDINARYQRVFGLLRDDFTATWLSPALAAQILSADREQRLRLGARFAPDAPLVRFGLIRFDRSRSVQGARTARPIEVAPRIARWILHAESLDPALDPWAWIELKEGAPVTTAKPVMASVDALLGGLVPEHQQSVVQVRSGSRRDLVEACRYLAARRSAPLLVADFQLIETLGLESADARFTLVREARLLGAVLLVLPPLDSQLADELFAALLVATRGMPQPLLFAGELRPAAVAIPGSAAVLYLQLPVLQFSERVAAWSAAISGLKKASGGGKKAAARLEELDSETLARRYRFSTGQIAQVLEVASQRALSRGETSPSAADVLVACGQTFLPSAGPLAETVAVRRSWEDLVLPADTRALLLEVVAQVERREEVLESVGQARVQAGERGVKVLFSGPPGTGKTLAAEVLAGALGYPLLRVDLSSVVSKWVGETEKQLSRLFDAAEQAPCLLLFDEADALFGNRSEVNDAQDRFANLEVSYLLQRLESFEGVAVLTTNIKRNIDEAFLRRFTAVVEFPFPEAAERLRIWQRMLPSAYPLASDVSLAGVAEEFKLAGANIWNVAVAAGVAAAESEAREISKSILAHAIRREYQKLGRKLAALRPQLLSSEQQAREELPAKRLRSQAMSAAEARRLRQREESLRPESTAQPGPEAAARAKPTA